MTPLNITITGPVTFQYGLQEDAIMASFTEVMTAVSELNALAHQTNDGLVTVAAHVQDLRDQLAAGGVVTEADMETLLSAVNDTKAPLQDALAKESAL